MLLIELPFKVLTKSRIVSLPVGQLKATLIPQLSYDVTLLRRYLGKIKQVGIRPTAHEFLCNFRR